jgi:hypothetical protein
LDAFQDNSDNIYQDSGLEFSHVEDHHMHEVRLSEEDNLHYDYEEVKYEEQ